MWVKKTKLKFVAIVSGWKLEWSSKSGIMIMTGRVLSKYRSNFGSSSFGQRGMEGKALGSFVKELFKEEDASTWSTRTPINQGFFPHGFSPVDRRVDEVDDQKEERYEGDWAVAAVAAAAGLVLACSNFLELVNCIGFFFYPRIVCAICWWAFKAHREHTRVLRASWYHPTSNYTFFPLHLALWHDVINFYPREWPTLVKLWRVIALDDRSYGKTY